MISLTDEELKVTDNDRCDRCGAKVQLVARLDSGGVLAFCGHHANEHRDRLTELRAIIAVRVGFC